MSSVVWTGLEPLEEGCAYLLEASAGTGKTWQIEALVLRLVAEYGLAIDTILVITFTKAATAELRERIRRRLALAREALGSSDVEPEDPIVLYLWRDVAQRPLRWQRLSRALSVFDLAPISTIHGFCQRTLEQLAFESGLEPGLELLADITPLLESLVDDELALVYAEADDVDLEVLEDMGWSRAELLNLARVMTGAAVPEVEPPAQRDEPAAQRDERAALQPDAAADHGGTALGRSALQHVRRWRQHSADLLAWLDDEPGRRAVEALLAEVARPTKATQRQAARRLAGRFLAGKGARSTVEKLRSWLVAAGPRSARYDGRALARWCRDLHFEELRAQWLGSEAELEAFGATPLFRRASAAWALQDELWALPRVDFARRVRGRARAELERRGLLTYDTMLSRLAERIEAQQGEAAGSDGALATAIRQRYQVALVDEFQDTDGAQWKVLRAVFVHPERRLLIIGDPKQAIYAFRGADVHVYLDAARVAGRRGTMQRNRRSDAAYVHALNHVFGEGSGVFELEGVDYVAVEAHHQAERLRGLPAIDARARAAFELRWCDAQTVGDGGVEPDSDAPSLLGRAAATELSARLCAAEAGRLLAAGVELCDGEPGGSGVAWRPLEPGDIAVLVRTNAQAERMLRRLAELGIPAVGAPRGTVLQSPVAGWLAAFLDALAAPGRDAPARALAVTPLFGWSGAELVRALEGQDTPSGADVPRLEPTSSREPRAASSESASSAVERPWDEWVSTLKHWAERYPSEGFVRVLESALASHDALPRLLSLDDGERYATDLRHLMELCHSEERRTRVGPAALAAWLRAEAARGGAGDDARTLRLESDALAVQVVTIHTSKGLEYPIVMLPFLWESTSVDERGQALPCHLRDANGAWRAVLDLHPKGSAARQRALDAARLEAEQEALRLAYVALTRARHHAVAWLGAIQSGASADGQRMGRPVMSALARVLARPRSAAGALTGERAAEALTRDVLFAVAESSGGSVGLATERWPAGVEPLRPALAALRPALAALPELRAKPWGGPSVLGSRFQVASYSSLARTSEVRSDEPHRADEVLVTPVELTPAASVDAEGAAGPEPTVPAPAEQSVEAASRLVLASAVPLAKLAGGTEVGTWVHAVLEHLDFERGCALDGRDAASLVASLGERHGLRAPEQQALLSDALPRILETPLDGAATGLPAGFCLRRLPRRDRVDELGFDLRLGAGTRRLPERAVAPGEPGGCIHEGAARLALERRLVEEPGWPGAGWLRAFLARAAVLPAMTGVLTGFIDLVLRVGEAPSSARYYVADYKTNRIAASALWQDTRALHYTQPWLHWEMARHGYPLQALLYTVALHRLLGQRLGARYDYDGHMGGTLYLFVRGMQGAAGMRDGGLALGVLHDRWPRRLVEGLDAALRGSSRDVVARILDRNPLPRSAP